MLCRRSAPEAPANIGAIRLAAYKGQLDAAEQASDAAAAAAAKAAQAAAPSQQGTSSQARAACTAVSAWSPCRLGRGALVSPQPWQLYRDRMLISLGGVTLEWVC